MEKDRQHFVAMLKGFHSAMLVTRAEDSHFHGRPMAIAKVCEDGTIYFSAHRDSAKVQEIKADSTVGVFFQDGGRSASLSGVAVVVNDRALIDEFWSEAWKVWFPEGKTDPNICLIEVVPRLGEYWDQSGLEGVKFFIEAAKAYVTGGTVDHDSGRNAKVAL